MKQIFYIPKIHAITFKNICSELRIDCCEEKNDNKHLSIFSCILGIKQAFELGKRYEFETLLH